MAKVSRGGLPAMPGQHRVMTSRPAHVKPATVAGTNAPRLKYRNAGVQARVKTGRARMRSY